MLQKKNQEGQFKRFLEVLKQIHINIPLVEALEQMSTYVKFLKDVLTKKHSLGELETVCLTKECSTILTSKILEKVKDPRSFTIPVSIGGHKIGQALCDLGASINLMPLSVYKRLGMGGVRPTTVTLQLSDRSIANPEGKIKVVMVQVDKFIFPADFIVLDFDADEDLPIILGRPFLATGRALVDVVHGLASIRRSCTGIIQCRDNTGAAKRDLARSWSRVHESLDLEDIGRKQLKPSIEEPPELELKVLLKHLKYAYLGASNTLPIIIVADLTTEKENELLAVLREHRKTIGWTIADIEGNKPQLLWRIYIDYKTLNKATRKDPFPLPFIDKMLDRLFGQEYYCFLDGYSGYNQITIAPQDQQKTTFTCPYGTFAFRRMPFGLCNALVTFSDA
ncbi:uncharacterized protein LOC111018898 [Momordica charantia]|uniref:Uncharacterized protein LOC111018898 n=1 Tax=Momordica charantia TaxID=3673 RepID=A0A6J1DAJ9_MOMCH|nr:uncharacterized protein LOC111018898 [Momordica charantia]